MVDLSLVALAQESPFLHIFLLKRMFEYLFEYLVIQRYDLTNCFYKNKKH